MNYKFLNLTASVFSLACLATLANSSVSYAGFQWTPPPRAEVPVQEALPAPEPVGPLTPELSIESESNLPIPVGNVEQTQIQEPVADTVSPQPPLAHNEIEQASDFPVIDGFGKDIPLAIALRDIAPPNFAYAFNPREIAGTKISWRGGKPWPEVLKDALGPHNLDGIVDGNTITIYFKEMDNASLPAVSNQISEVSAEVNSGTQAHSSDPLPLVDPEPIINETPAVEASQEKPIIPVVDLKNHKKWSARPGTTLRQTLESWSKSAGTEINWSTPYDYPINNAFYFEGNFSDAVQSLLSSYSRENPSPKGRLYPNLPDGPSVLMIN